MRRLLNRSEAPPQDGDGNSFRYVFPEDGFLAYASDYNTWSLKIKEHAQGNGIAVPDMSTCEDQLCGTLPPDRCQYELGDAQPVNITFTAADVVSWIQAVTTKLISGAQYVSQAEAERRAAICVRCPLNSQIIGGCGGGCSKLAEMLTPGMRKRFTSQDDKLKSCAICHCYNKISVHFPLEVLKASSINHADYPSFCWRK